MGAGALAFALRVRARSRREPTFVLTSCFLPSERREGHVSGPTIQNLNEFRN